MGKRFTIRRFRQPERFFMSNTVLLIALAHGLFPLIGGMVGKKVGVVFGAIVGVAFAILTGGSRYAFVDILGVAVGFALAWALFENTSKKDENNQ